MAGGMCGRWGMHGGGGSCMAGGCAWQGGFVCGRGCMAEGVCGRRAGMGGRILLECILVTLYLFNISVGKANYTMYIYYGPSKTWHKTFTQRL